MSTLQINSLSFLLPISLLLFAISCSLDDEASGNNLTASDLEISVVENQVDGTELGQVIASTERAELEFEVLNSDPTGAIEIDEQTGVVKVGDEELFDFEERSEINGMIRVRSGSEFKDVSIKINLEDEQADIVSFNRLTEQWVVKEFIFNAIFATMEVHNCRLDDKMKISGTGEYIYDGGDMLCGNEDSQRFKSGTWDLDEHLEFVLFDKGTEESFKADIEIFEEGRIVLSGKWMGITVSGEYVKE